MELLLRMLIVIAVVVVVLLGVYYALQSSFFQHVTKQQAESLVTADLQRLYPNSAINITNDTASTYSGSWHIAVSVVLNATSPCPSFFVYTFDYPQFGFVYRVQNTYTNNCVIYGLSQNKTFIVSSYPVAITKSYVLGVPSIRNYLNSQGFGSVTVTARFFSSTAILGTNYTNVWLVKYSSTKATYSVYALLSQVNGTLLRTYNLTGS